MAKDDIKRYSLEELQAKHERGDTLTRADAPESELDEHFWRNARIVMPDDKGKIPVSLRVDTEVVEWFKQQGKGYLTRMNAVLRAYVETQKRCPVSSPPESDCSTPGTSCRAFVYRVIVDRRQHSTDPRMLHTTRDPRCSVPSHTTMTGFYPLHVRA